jgi:hypothetical protein
MNLFENSDDMDEGLAKRTQKPQQLQVMRRMGSRLFP